MGKSPNFRSNKYTHGLVYEKFIDKGIIYESAKEYMLGSLNKGWESVLNLGSIHPGSLVAGVLRKWGSRSTHRGNGFQSVSNLTQFLLCRNFGKHNYRSYFEQISLSVLLLQIESEDMRHFEMESLGTGPSELSWNYTEL